MDDKLKQEMMSYYEERALEYDGVYSGKNPATLDPAIYKKDVAVISQMVSLFGKGHVIDIGCGTGFWLPYYARNCSHITLIDQSEKMLLECKSKADKLGIQNKCHFVQGDFFGIMLESSEFDSTIVGFFISHLSLELEQIFFAKLKKILKPNAQLMFIDSVWNRKRQHFSKKEGFQKRLLNNGRTFTIYKRYFSKYDIESLSEKYLFKLKFSYMGDAFLATIGENQE